MSPIITTQRRMMELGRVRLGEKGPKGEPKRLSTFRFTSASKDRLDQIAALWGGTVRAWTGAPDEGYFEVTTEATEIEIVLPPVFSSADGEPTLPYSQFFELWSGGGCQRRCDGITEAFSGEGCLCNPDNRECKVTTRVSFMLPEIKGLGVWRLDSHGWNAATELPGTLEVLALAAAADSFVPAVLRVEPRTKKVDGQTRRFVVPVIDLRVSMNQLQAGEGRLSLNAPTHATAGRPALPPAIPLQETAAFDNDLPNFGEPPEIPGEPALSEGGRGRGQTRPAADEGPAVRTPAPSSESATPLTSSEFSALVKEGGIETKAIVAKGRELFAGKSARTLSDEERGRLYAALLS